MASILLAFFNLAVLLPGIGLAFFPQATCEAFSMPSITSSTLHLSRLIGIRNVTFGVALALSKPKTEFRRTVILLAAVTEALDVGAGFVSWASGDMATPELFQSSGAAGLVALCGFASLGN